MPARTENDPRSERPGRFFAVKQLALFAVMTMAVILVDILLLFGISAAELMNNHAWDGDNSGYDHVRVAELAGSLSQNADGTWALDSDDIGQNIKKNLDAAGCWAAVLNPDGSVAWRYNTPENFPTAFSQNDIAVMAHDRELLGATTFIWTKDPYLVVLCYPSNEYTSFGFTLDRDALERIPLYVLLFFVVDLAIIFLLYTFSQRSVVKNIAPTLHALDSLAESKPTQVRFGGILRPVGTRINQVSRTLEHKETARKNWIAGVSHDVRTPLAVVMGHAERLEVDPALPAEQQKTAGTIVQQSVRIRDLVEDLNIATQLEYDMQPLKMSSIPLARLMREVAADYLNQGLNGNAEISLDIEDAAANATLQGDERLMRRALSNALNNALKHNQYDCAIELGLHAVEGAVRLSVSDDGQGMAPEKLGNLARMLQEDYLGHGLLAELDSTHFAFAASGNAEILPLSTAPNAPEAPLPYAKPSSYPASYQAPAIKQWGRKKGAAPQPPAVSTPEPQEAFGALTQTDEAAAPHATIGQHGLGMPLIARIVLVHGGTFTVQSEEGKGFSIVMQFPLQ